MSKYAAHGDEAIGQVHPVTGVLRKKAVYNYPVVTGPPCGVKVFAAKIKLMACLFITTEVVSLGVAIWQKCNVASLKI